MRNKFIRVLFTLLLVSSLLPGVAFGQGPVPPNRVRGEIFMYNTQDLTTGAIFFVDDSGSDSTGLGRDPARPFATLNYAIGRCAISPAAVSTGCTIYLMPGHAETISTDDGVNITVAGISIIGLGRGGLRPAFSFSTVTSAAFSVEAADVEIANIEFIANIANLVTFIDLQATADGAYIHDNLFREGSQTGVAMVSWSGIADDVVIDNNQFYAPTAGNYDEAIHMVTSTSTRGVITNNTIIGDFDDAAIHNPTSNVATLFNISNNIVSNALTGAHAIEMVSAVTGFATGNVLQSNLLATSFDPGSLMLSGNTWTSGIDMKAMPIPVYGEFFPGFGYRVQKSSNLTDPDPLFDYTGQILITLITGEVTTAIATTTTLILETTTGSIALNAATTITTDGDGHVYLWCGDQGEILNGAIAPTVELASCQDDPFNPILLGNEGVSETIRAQLDASGSAGATILFTIFYLPVTPGATVTAAN